MASTADYLASIDNSMPSNSSFKSPEATHELKGEMNEMKSSLSNVMGVLKDLETLILRLNGDVAGRDLLSKMLCLGPKWRISGEYALQHEYIVGI